MAAIRRLFSTKGGSHILAIGSSVRKTSLFEHFVQSRGASSTSNYESPVSNLERLKAILNLSRTDRISSALPPSVAVSNSHQHLVTWKMPPKKVLLLKTLDDELTEETKTVASFLHKQGMTVYVEGPVHDQLTEGCDFLHTLQDKSIPEPHKYLDFIVCLGGDKVILHASHLFPSSIPPLIAFNTGTPGVLTTHRFEEHEEGLKQIIQGDMQVTTRKRLQCQIFNDSKGISEVFPVLNELVLDRGNSPYFYNFEIHTENQLITKVKADGILIATPTGSTAYSTAAGGSMVHPTVPCVMLTAICPQALSFRPMVLPDSTTMELKVVGDGCISIDGRKHPLTEGNLVRVQMSRYPLVTCNKTDKINDWFDSLTNIYAR